MVAATSSERWITPVVITVAGFLTGFIFVYLLRGSEPDLPADESAVASEGGGEETGGGAPAAGAAAATGGPATDGTPPRPQGSSGDAAAAQLGAPSGEASPGGVAAPTAAPTAAPLTGAPAIPGEAVAPATPASPVAAAPAATTVPAPTGPAPTGPVTPPGAASAPATAAAKGGPGDPWTALLGKPCTLGFGNLQAVMVRQGDLSHGQEVLWKRDIGGRPRAGRISRDEGATVVPLAFGFHPSGGRPSAAYVRIQSGKRTFDGVIPLRVADQYLELQPVEIKAASGVVPR